MLRKLTQFITFSLILVIVSFSLFGLTKEQVAEIASKNIPSGIIEWHNLAEPNPTYDIVFTDPLKMINMRLLAYLEIEVEGDNSKYLLLAWDYRGEVFLRLLKSTDTGCYTLFQDFSNTYDWGGMESNPSIYFRQEKLTGGVNPEILLSDAPNEMSCLVVFQWRNGKLVDIAREDNFIGNSIIPKFSTSLEMSVVLQDLDEDDKAEIIVYPWGRRYPVNPPDTDDWEWVFDGPLRIYKYDGSFYTLWQEYPFSLDNPYPISVPTIAGSHPSTIPYSELSNCGNGKMRIFVCNPPKGFTVDDIDTTKFAYKGNSLNFKKKWKNQKYPDTASANFEWQGSPVRQIKRQSQGEWQLNPSDPFILSPDGEMEYHFVGPYLELEISKSLFFPDIQNKASSFFEENSEKQTFFVSVPITGKMKNGKLLSVSALICIKKTGNIAQDKKPQNVDTSKKGEIKQTKERGM